MYAYEIQCSGSLGVSAMVHNGNAFQYVIASKQVLQESVGENIDIFTKNEKKQ